MDQILRVKLVRSPSGRLPKHRKTVAALGLRRLNQVVEVKDNPAMRGMLNQVAFLLKVEKVQEVICD
jgi:large subunit ribosomal protein L30